MNDESSDAIERCKAQIDTFLTALPSSCSHGFSFAKSFLSRAQRSAVILTYESRNFKVPWSLSQLKLPVFKEFFFTMLQDETLLTEQDLEKLVGQSRAEALQMLELNDKPLRNFHEQLRHGLFDEIYQREKELASRIHSIKYSQLIARNHGKALALAKSGRQEHNHQPLGITFSDRVCFSLSSESSSEEAEEETETTWPIGSPEADLGKSRGRNAITVTTASATELADFHAQETERYSQPSKPFTYKLKSGEMRSVAPVCRKGETLAKARDHALLKAERPACVTLLSIVRDAAAKLPKGFGSRSDICELVKESQFINSEGMEDQLSSVVSGALDRLHYECDPCVKFDSHRKLWFYLHMDRKDFGPEAVDREESQFSQSKRSKAR